MQQPPVPNNPNEYIMTLTTMSRQLERLDERTRDLATRSDLEGVRKELVARESLEPQLSNLQKQIMRVDQDRLIDRTGLEKRIDELELEQLSRQDRFWIRLAQAIGFAGFVLALFEFLSHLKFLP